jgi:hypothetical protein
MYISVLRKNPGFDAPTGFETVHTTADSRADRDIKHTQKTCVYTIYIYIITIF